MNKRIVITGLGVITPVGNSVNEFWNNIINGVCGLENLVGFDEFNCPVKVAGQIKNFNPTDYGVDAGTARRSDLYCQFALAAASQAMADSGIESGKNILPERLGVYVGSGIGGINTLMREAKKLYEEGVNRISPLFVPMMIGNIAAGNIAIRYNAQGPCLPIVTACATGTHSAGEAYRAIKHGYADVIITGGAEAAVHPISIGGFANSRALSMSKNPLEASLPFDKRRDGFVIAEGAGIMVFEEMEHAVSRGAKIYAEVIGYGNSCDAYHYTAPRPDASAASKAIKEALYGIDITNKTIYINAHGTGTPLNDKTETAAIKLALGEEAAYKAIISSTKSMTGHMLGATGAVELIASALVLQENIIPPTIGLKEKDPECDLDYTPNVARRASVDISISNSLGFGGHNSCISLKRLEH
ncbi:MAG TPA: beta-ketoacyl-ACP synthase II [Bacteroidetes bacterium]|nr:beta-ketoacyl-ACP synthase II [Bacteroidota bacterium]